MSANVLSFTAAEAIDANRIVSVNSSSSAASFLVEETDSSTTSSIVGVTIDSAASGDPVPVQIDGIVDLYVNGNSVNITVGGRIVATTGGVGILISATSATEQYVVGTALEASAADGDIIKVRLNGPYLAVKGTA